jgi:glycerate-2-kinase
MIGSQPNSGRCLAKNLTRVAGGKLLGAKSGAMIRTLFTSD